MIGIYKITNPKGRIYIGQSIDINKRWDDYQKYINCKTQPKLFNSLNKYTPQNHKFEVIEECKIEELNDKEEHYILLFESHIKGLNCKIGSKPSWTGKKRPQHSQWLKENGCGLSYERTEKHKNHLRDVLSGRKLSKEICKKISQNKIGKGLKPIICDTLFGMEFKSLTEASEILNLNKGNICEVLKGTKTHIKGFVFRYLEN